jgi:hypothetical protein
VVLSGCGLRTRRERYLVVLTSATAQTRGQVSAACQPGVPAAIRAVRLAAEIEARLRSGALPAELGAVFGQLRAQIDDAVRRAIAD